MSSTAGCTVIMDFVVSPARRLRVTGHRGAAAGAAAAGKTGGATLILTAVGELQERKKERGVLKSAEPKVRGHLCKGEKQNFFSLFFYAACYEAV